MPLPCSYPAGRIRRQLWLAVPVVALSAVLAACGGAPSTSAANPTTTTTGGASLSAYTQCLESHGVPASATRGFGAGRRGGATAGTTVPGSATTRPTPTGTRPTIPAQYQAAFQTCRSLLPAGGRGAGFGSGAQFAAYRNCLQLHGVTLPAPPTTTPGQPAPTGGFAGNGGGLGGGLGSGQANTPAFRAARQACVNLLPARNGTTTTTVAPPG